MDKNKARKETGRKRGGKRRTGGRIYVSPSSFALSHTV